MKRSVLWVLSILAMWSSCALPAQLAPGSGPTTGGVRPASTSASLVEIPTTPEVPAEPKRFEVYVREGVLFPPGVGSAFAVWAPHPTDRTLFLAWGFDVKNRKTVFYLVGRKDVEYSSFMKLLALNQAAIASQPSTLQVSLGATGQIEPGPPSPPDPGPIIHDWAWTAVFKSYQAQQELMAKYAASTAR